MRLLKLCLAISTLLAITTSKASPLSAPTVNLGGMVIVHPMPGGKNTKLISLEPLAKYAQNAERVSWAINCDYYVQETSGAPPPGVSAPFKVKIGIDDGSHAIGQAYTKDGLVDSTGTLVLTRQSFAKEPFSDDFNNIFAENMDSSRDLILRNCIATMQLY